MAASARLTSAGEQAREGARGRGDAVLAALAAVTLALVAVQFAAAGFGAFSMVKTATDSNAYKAHMALGMITAAMTLLVLGAVLASRAARQHRRTLGMAVILAVLAVPVEPLLGEAGKHAPWVGALHALVGVAIAALLFRLLTETTSRRGAGARPGAPTAGPRANAQGS